MTAIACRVCGKATTANIEVREGRSPLGQRDGNDITVGTCETCETLDTVTPGMAVRACLRLIKKPESEYSAFGTVLQDMELDAAAVLYDVTGHPHRGPQSKAFGHVPREVKAELKRAYARVLADRVAATLPQPEPTPEPPPTGLACLACGLDRAIEWHGPLHTFGLVRGPDPVDGYVCPACAATLEQVGAVGEGFLEQAVMSAKGIDWVPRVRAWVATGLPPQDQPWAWMGDLQAPPLTLDPFSALQEMISALQGEVDELRVEVDALRSVPVP